MTDAVIRKQGRCGSKAKIRLPLLLYRKEMEEIPVDKEIKIQKIKKKLVASFFYLF